jgi:hypothetical protein
MSVQINNLENLSVAELRSLVNQGGKFVYFPYTISIIFMTFQNKSDIYFIRPNENSLKYSVGFILMNLVLGWWGIPWGPIYTIGALIAHLGGGKDVTEPIMSHMIQNDPNAATNTYNLPNTNTNTNVPAPAGTSAYNIPNSGGSSGSPYNIQ